MGNTIIDVEAQLNRWFEALKTGNPDTVVALYASDATLLSTYKSEIKKGHQKIREYFKQDFIPKHPIGGTVESYTRLMGNIAINTGKYRFEIDSTQEERATAEARYTFVYQWTDNDWKIVEHHSSLNPEG